MPYITKKFDIKLAVPHIGKNNIVQKGESILFRNIPNDSDFYFVHQYYIPECRMTKATVNYEIDFTATVEYNNFFGVQFHPEKSGKLGEIMLKNFLRG
jgi:glutamine amidotransferase